MVRIAVVTDIHHVSTSRARRRGVALQLLADFVDWANGEKPDLVLDLGDRISDIDRETDLNLQREVAKIFARLNVPVQHLCGNHDRDNLSAVDNAAIFGSDPRHALIDLGGWQVALWRADTRFSRMPDNPGFRLGAGDLEWIAKLARLADKPTLVASHVPFSGHSQIGNHYFERNVSFATYPEAGRIRGALSRAAVPLCCIAGHVHRNTVTTIDGIPHLTQQSLTEGCTTGGVPARAWGLLSLGTTVHWKVYGRDPFEASLTPSTQRWLPPLDPVTWGANVEASLEALAISDDALRSG